MPLLTRTESLAPGELAKQIKRTEAGERFYCVPEKNLSPTEDPFQAKINALRRRLNLFSAEECAGTCGGGQALSYYAFQDEKGGSLHLHQFGDLFTADGSHAFLVYEPKEGPLRLIDLTFAQFTVNLLCFEEEKECYDRLICYGWIELTERVIKAYQYAIHGKRTDLPPPSIKQFKTPSMECPDFTPEELDKYYPQ